MNKKLIAAVFGLASLVSGCVASQRTDEQYRTDIRNYENREYHDIKNFIEPRNDTTIPRYRKR